MTINEICERLSDLKEIRYTKEWEQETTPLIDCLVGEYKWSIDNAQMFCILYGALK